MAEFSAWIHNMHTELETNSNSATIKPQHMQREDSFNASFGWSSEDDTDSESEQSCMYSNTHNNNMFVSRRKQPAHYAKTHKFSLASPSRATPVTIPARTHDFGWCDRDDERLSARAACPCGNDCDEFFEGVQQHSATSTDKKCSQSHEDAQDDFIFDMEM